MELSTSYARRVSEKENVLTFPSGSNQNAKNFKTDFYLDEEGKFYWFNITRTGEKEKDEVRDGSPKFTDSIARSNKNFSLKPKAQQAQTDIKSNNEHLITFYREEREVNEKTNEKNVFIELSGRIFDVKKT